MTCTPRHAIRWRASPSWKKALSISIPTASPRFRCGTRPRRAWQRGRNCRRPGALFQIRPARQCAHRHRRAGFALRAAQAQQERRRAAAQLRRPPPDRRNLKEQAPGPPDPGAREPHRAARGYRQPRPPEAGPDRLRLPRRRPGGLRAGRRAALCAALAHPRARTLWAAPLSARIRSTCSMPGAVSPAAAA